MFSQLIDPVLLNVIDFSINEREKEYIIKDIESEIIEIFRALFILLAFLNITSR